MRPETLAALRAHRGWSQAETARQLGIDRKTLRTYERGLSPIPTVVALACTALANWMEGLQP